MATLHIFGDESGTMPANDNDKPFVATTVAVIGKSPTLIEGSENDGKMVEIFKSLNINPFAVIVKPYPGYGKALKTKHDKIQTMARAARLVTGANALYLDDKTLSYGFDLRDTVWGFAMLQAIANVVLSTVFTNAIGSVQIILDRKSMKPSMRSCFKEMVVTNMGAGTRNFLASIIPLNPTVISQWESRVQFSAETTSINWSDDAEGLDDLFGLKLADRLARKIYQAQVALQPGIDVMLKDAGFENFVFDISKVVTCLDPRVIDNFKRNTGLPEPLEL